MERTGIEIIAEERRRQIAEEGWSDTHDDEHKQGEIAVAAATYALSSAYQETKFTPPHSAAIRDRLFQMWPWSRAWFKPKSPIRDLARAGALIAAEIDRRKRAGEEP